MWILEDEKKVDPYSSPNFKLNYVESKKGSRVITMMILRPGSTTTIMYSHGNATDLGCVRDHLLDMSERLKVNIFAYDYSGYGLSSGEPTVHNTLADSEAAFSFLTTTFPTQCGTLILYGQSLGSGPTIHLAQYNHALVSGIVIHSGLLSGVRAIKPVNETYFFDIFTNIDNIKETICPVFVVHGTEDLEIPLFHGKEFANNAPNPYKPWFVHEGGHNNIEVNFRPQLFRKLREFIKDLNTGKVKALAMPIHLMSSSSSSSSTYQSSRSDDIYNHRYMPSRNQSFSQSVSQGGVDSQVTGFNDVAIEVDSHRGESTRKDQRSNRSGKTRERTESKRSKRKKSKKSRKGGSASPTSGNSTGSSSTDRNRQPGQPSLGALGKSQNPDRNNSSNSSGRYNSNNSNNGHEFGGGSDDQNATATSSL